MKYGFLSVAAALAVLTLTGCQREDLTVNTSDSSDVLKFSVGFAGSGELVLSKGAALASEDGTVSIPLSCTVTDGIGVNLPDAVTKGTQINNESEFLGAELTSFTAAGWNADKTEFVPSATAVKYSSDKWKTDATYRWRGSGSKTFLAYANLPASGTVTNSADPVKQTFTYTVPTDARQQNDIMLGWYKGNGGGTATAAITMVHPLTAVVFKMGEIDASVTAIKSISISGVYVSGTTDVTYDLPGSDVVPTYNWGSTRTGSQTVTLAPLSPSEVLEIDEDDNTIGVPFIILPQTVAAGTLTLTITVVKDGADAVLAASVPAGTWAEGKTNTYTIGYSSPLLPGIFSVSATKQVRFAKGNLYCKRSGSAGSYTYEFAMESHQYDYRTRPASMVASLVSGPCVIDGVMGETPDNMSGFFLWDIYDKAGYGAFETSLTSGTTAESDVLDYGQVFGSDSKWTTLTKSEFEYLTNGGPSGSPSRADAGKLIKKATIHLSGTVDIVGYVIAPDDFIGTLAAEYTLSEWETAEEASSLVFLPWIGSASGNSLSSTGIFYWSQSASETNDYYAYCLKQNYDVPAISGTSRAYAFPVRLVQRFDKPEVEPDFIDLGLPSGTLWADVNAGAVSKTGAGSYGKFYAWGETESKTTYTIDNYKFTSSFTKYNGTDGLTVLDLVYDAAYAFDGKSVIPTREQYEELINSTYTTCTWKDDYQSTGIPGLEIKSKSNGNSIFLPAAGLQNEASLALVGTNGCYWSSTLNPTPKEGAGTSFPACAIDLDFEKNTAPFVYIDNDNSQRYMGQSIRAVKLNAVKPTPALSYNINGGTGATMPSGGTFTAGDFVTVQAPMGGTPVRGVTKKSKGLISHSLCFPSHPAV